MRLLKIILHNFMQHEHTEITFPYSGVISISGKNGTGKTTLVTEGVTFCGYGKVKGKTMQEIPRILMKKNDTCYVEMYFELHGKLYRMRRDTKKTKETFLATSEGVILHLGKKEVTSGFENLLRVDFDTFCNAYIARQRELDTLLLGKDANSQRKELIAQLMKLDSFDLSSEKAKNKAKELELEATQLKNSMIDVEEQSKLLQNHIFVLDVLSNELQGFEQLYKQQQQELQEKRIKLESQEANYKTYQNLIRLLDSLTQQNETYTKQLLEKQFRLENLSQMKTRHEDLKHHKANVDLLEQKVQTLTLMQSQFKQKNRLEVQLQQQTKSYSDVKKAHDSLEIEIHGSHSSESPTITIQSLEKDSKNKQEQILLLHEERQKVKGEGQGIARLIQEEEKKKQQFFELGPESPCPTCHQPLGTETYEHELEKIEKKIQSLQDEKDTLLTRYQEITVSMQYVQKETDHINVQITMLRQEELVYVQKSERIKGLFNEATGIYKQIVSIKAQLEEFQEISFDDQELASVSQSLQQEKKLYEEWLKIDALIQEIPSLQHAIDELTEKIEAILIKQKEEATRFEELNFNEDAFDSLRREVHQLHDTVTYTNQQLVDKKVEAERRKQLMDSVEQQIQQQTSNVIRINELHEDIVMYRTMMSSFKGAKEKMLVQLSPKLSTRMSENIRTLTNGRYDLIQLDKSYYPFMYKDGEKKPWSFFSGGEQRLLALLLRLSISDLLVASSGSSFNLLVLDEVFGEIDHERQENSMILLRQLQEKFSQVMVITHSEGIKDMSDCMLKVYILNGKSKAVWASVPPHMQAAFKETERILEQYAS
ncbi:SMC family ATPase [Bacillus bombysepticus]|uniref:SMC family ATPase n=1 Tax=Bacillus bombysepticus TaxID=658666 RepID=UPI00301678BF